MQIQMDALARTLLGWLTSSWHWMHGILGWPSAIWNGLSFDGKVETACALFVGFLAVLIPILIARRANSKVLKSRLLNRVEIVEEVAINEIVGFISSKPHWSGKLENYIEREPIRAAFGDELVPRKRQILFCGASGAGKTREAIELI